MAHLNIPPKNRTKSATAEPTRAPRRASQRTAAQRVLVSIDLANDALRHLMTEQCKNGPHYITVYRGSRSALTAAGVPEAAFQHVGTGERFQVQTLNVCCTGSAERLTGSMQVIDGDFEMEIDWGLVRPYVQCAHPAVGELARMLLIDIGAFAENRTKVFSRVPDLAYPLDYLAADERAVDYKPQPGAPRFQVTAEFHKILENYARQVFESVHTDCEVMPVTDAAAKPVPRLRLVADNSAAVQP